MRCIRLSGGVGSKFQKKLTISQKFHYSYSTMLVPRGCTPFPFLALPIELNLYEVEECEKFSIVSHILCITAKNQRFIFSAKEEI